MKGKREEPRRASGQSEKSFCIREKKSLRFSRVVPARGPAGWAGGRAGGQVRGGGGGTEAALRWPRPPPLPTAPPSPDSSPGPRIPSPAPRQR